MISNEMFVDIVGLYQGVGPQGGGSVFTQGGDHHGGHGEEQGSLVEVIYHAQVFKAGHDAFLLKNIKWDCMVQSQK